MRVRKCVISPSPIVFFIYALLLSGQIGKTGKLQKAMLVYREELDRNEFSLSFSIFKMSISIIRRDGIIRNGMTDISASCGLCSMGQAPGS